MGVGGRGGWGVFPLMVKGEGHVYVWATVHIMLSHPCTRPHIPTHSHPFPPMHTLTHSHPLPPMQGKRYILPNTSVMLHHPSGTARGQASDIYNEARELMRLRDYVNNVLSIATGQPLERVWWGCWVWGGGGCRGWGGSTMRPEVDATPIPLILYTAAKGAQPQQIHGPQGRIGVWCD